MNKWFIGAAMVLLSAIAVGQDNFPQAKSLLKRSIYLDRTDSEFGTFYCGCSWDWVGSTGGRVDKASCGYETRAQENRAARTEWEHVVPAWVVGHQRQCWQNGGRKNCQSDPVFTRMEADPFNLVIAVGEVNADRSNFSFGVLPRQQKRHGQCDFKVDFKQRTVEPRDAVKGFVARVYFYMHDRYNLRMSRQQQQLMMAWDKQYPVSDWERLRDKRLAAATGRHNPFVTGERTWTFNHRNNGDGLTALPPAKQYRIAGYTGSASTDSVLVRGNRRSKVYHLSTGCPSYDRVSEKNRVSFDSENDAVNAGYRKAGNCR